MAGWADTFPVKGKAPETGRPGLQSSLVTSGCVTPDKSLHLLSLSLLGYKMGGDDNRTFFQRLVRDFDAM